MITKKGKSMNLRNMTLTLASAAAGLFAQAAIAQDFPATNLKVQGGWATAGIFQEYEVPFWKERLPRLSGGRVTADVTNLNEMGLRGPEVFRLMRLGVIDFGTSALGYAAGDDAENEAPDLAGIAVDIGTARRVNDAYKETLSDLYEKKYGIKLLILYPAEAQVFWCNGKIEKLSDLRGKKVRTGNRTVADFVEAAGGTTVTLPFGEVVPALQRKVIDCAVTGTFSGNSAGWHEVTTHLYPMTVGWSPFMYAVNKRAWDRLDPRVRNLISTEMTKLENEIWDAAGKRTTEGLNCATGGACTFGKKGTMALVPVAREDEAARMKLVQDVVLDRFAKRCGAACAKAWNASISPIVGVKAPE